MPETVIDLGKRVKAKYPGQYDDLSDADVGKRTKAKYPTEYADFSDAPSENLDAIRAAQAAKFGSKEAMGGDVSAGARFLTNFLGGANKAVGLLQHPLDSLSGMPKALLDSKNSALQAAAARDRGEANPDPYGLLPLTDAATNGDLATVGGEVLGQGAGTALTSVALGAGGEALRRTVPQVLRGAMKTMATPESFASKAATLRQPPAPAGLGAELAVPTVSAGVGHMIAGPEGAAAASVIAETVMRLKQSPVFRGMSANMLESAARWMVKNDMAPPGTGFAGELPPQTGNVPLEENAIQGALPRTSEGSVRESASMNTPSPAAEADQFRPQFSEGEPVVGEVAGNPRQFDSKGAPRPTVDLNTSEPAPAVPDAPSLNKWMNVRGNQLRFGNNPAEQILADKLLGPDKASTLENVTSARKSVGAQMEGAFKAAETEGVRFDLDTEIQQAVADAKKTYGKGSDEAFQKQLDNLQDQFVQQNGDLKNATPSEAHAFEKDLGKGINFESASTSDVAKVMKDIRGRVNRLLKSNVKGIADLKDRWGNLYEAEKSLKSSIRQDQVGRGTGSVFDPTRAKKPGVSAGVAPKEGL